MHKNMGLARVEQDPSLTDLDPERKTMFRKQAVALRRILNKD
ncbi:MAG: hypothetical protein ACOCUY_03715 [Verrucomicrobiota bacterium]